MVGSSGSSVQGLEHATVHQTLHGLLLRDRNEMGFCLAYPQAAAGGIESGRRQLPLQFLD
jgi:hypothetical protein